MKNIIITGGGFVNKGAQAMTFITISELRKRFPNHEILLYAPVELSDKNLDLSIYNFGFVNWNPIIFAKAQSNPLLNIACTIKNKTDYSKAKNIYKNCDLMVDISGYAIGSNWRKKICSDYLDNIQWAKAFNIPIYLLPQSFGPFDYSTDEGYEIDRRTAELFPYVKTIFAREKEGYDALISRYNLKNVELADDIVLCCKIEKYDVFNEGVNINIPKIRDNSIGIVPNSKTIEFGNEEELINSYKSIIETLLKSGKIVYLLNHSKFDFKYCEKIKALFIDNDNVINIQEDLNCIQFNEIVKQLDFIIASRFHSIVHAYKNGTPCIALGWATKYHDLLGMFDQSRYMFDVRTGVDNEKLLGEVNCLLEKHQDEKKIILEKLKDIQKKNVFDKIEI